MFGLKLKWLGCACFEMDFGGLHIVSDPWIGKNEKTDLTYETVEKCDYIVLTHGHHDHITDIPALVEKFNPCVLCGEGTATPLMQWADINPMKVYPMTPNLELDFEAVKVQALFGRHTPQTGTFREREEFWANHRLYGQDALIRQLNMWGDFEYRNYLFTTPDGTKILLWGNTISRPEERNVLRQIHPDIAIMQTTRQEDMAVMCKEMGCKVVIPHHIDYPKDYTQLVEDLGKSLATVAPEIQYIVPQYGKWMTL